jgi:hypothetical protein
MKTALVSVLIAASCTTPAVAAELWDDLVLDRPATISPAGFAQRQAARRITTPPPPPIPTDWQCSEWYDTTLDAGFSRDDWPAIGIIMWRESRCNPTAHNGRDPNTGSFGLMQINGYWCRGGGLRNLGWGSGNHCPAMFDPATNLRAARAIADYDLERGRCPWTQWSTRQGLC